MLMHPSYVDRVVGFQPFPTARTEYLDHSKAERLRVIRHLL
jgi:hypothetical protein